MKNMELIPEPRIEMEPDPNGKTRIMVRTYWHGNVDRHEGYGMSRGSNMKLAERLCKAIKAGAAYPNPTLATDIYGSTYVSHGLKVMGRHLNADLKRLGF